LHLQRPGIVDGFGGEGACCEELDAGALDHYFDSGGSAEGGAGVGGAAQDAGEGVLLKWAGSMNEQAAFAAIS
jgi:hypothetical protein